MALEIMIRVWDFVLKIMGSYQWILNQAVTSGCLVTRLQWTGELGAREKRTQRNHFGGFSLNTFERYMSLKSKRLPELFTSVILFPFISALHIQVALSLALCLGLVV